MTSTRATSGERFVPGTFTPRPGAGSPTVMPWMGRDDSVAVHAVCQEAVFWETLEKLKRAGASAILVLPIEKMM